MIPAWYFTSVKILNLSDNPTPSYQTSGSAGFDIAASEDVVIEGAGVELIPTGIHLRIPYGYEGQLRLRSSMYKKNVVMPNAPGTIDSDYRGEIKIPLKNLSPYGFAHFKKGDRIAQIVIHRCPQALLEEVSADEFESCEDTSRGVGGFGSTGVK